MCRALLYLGQPVLLDDLLYRPDSALVRQSYMPKMLHLLNLAGFGMRAWDPASPAPLQPYSYAVQSLPVFDRNLKSLAEKIHPAAVLAHVRGVPYSTRVDISLQNVHPFQFPRVPLAMAHNGDLWRFAEMRPLLARHVRPELLRHVSGTTDSEWIYALVLSNLRDPHARADADELIRAIAKAFAVLRRARAQLGIDITSPVNLFFGDGRQLVAVRYCFDFGCYPTSSGEALNPNMLAYYSLWYTVGRRYGLHDGEWRMSGGSRNADSILVASEPLTSDVSSWVEVPEYAALQATLSGGRPAIRIDYLD